MVSNDGDTKSGLTKPRNIACIGDPSVKERENNNITSMGGMNTDDKNIISYKEEDTIVNSTINLHCDDDFIRNTNNYVSKDFVDEKTVIEMRSSDNSLNGHCRSLTLDPNACNTRDDANTEDNESLTNVSTVPDTKENAHDRKEIVKCSDNEADASHVPAVLNELNKENITSLDIDVSIPTDEPHVKHINTGNLIPLKV